MKRFVLLVAIVAVLSGCAGLNPPPEYYDAQAKLSKYQAEISKQPLLTITGEFSCKGSDCSISVFDPKTKLPGIVKGIGSAEVLQTAIKEGAGIAKFGIGGYVIGRALREVGDKNYNVINQGDGTQTFNNDTHVTSFIKTDDSVDTNGGDIGDRIQQDNDTTVSNSGNTSEDNDVTNDNDVIDSYNDNSDNSDSSTHDNPVTTTTGGAP